MFYVILLHNWFQFSGSWSPGIDYFRLDGSTSCENRSIWCKNFNREDNPRARYVSYFGIFSSIIEKGQGVTLTVVLVVTAKYSLPLKMPEIAKKNLQTVLGFHTPPFYTLQHGQRHQ